MQALSLTLFVFFLIAFFGLAFTLGQLPVPSRISYGLDIIFPVIVLLAGFGFVLILHESIHGQFMRLCGGHPVYGVIWKQGVFYAISPGYPYRRGQYLLVELAPLVLISLLGALGIWLLAGTFWVAILAILAATNAAGAAGDLWMSYMALRYRANAFFVDERDGVRIFLPAKEYLPDAHRSE